MKKLITIAILLIMTGCGDNNEDQWFIMYESPSGSVRVYVDMDSEIAQNDAAIEQIYKLGDRIDHIERGPISKCNTKVGCHDED